MARNTVSVGAGVILMVAGIILVAGVSSLVAFRGWPGLRGTSSSQRAVASQVIRPVPTVQVVHLGSAAPRTHQSVRAPQHAAAP